MKKKFEIWKYWCMFNNEFCMISSLLFVLILIYILGV